MLQVKQKPFQDRKGLASGAHGPKERRWHRNLPPFRL